MYIYVNYLKTVSVNYSLGNGMVNHRTIITLQCDLNEHTVTRLPRLHVMP